MISIYIFSTMVMAGFFLAVAFSVGWLCGRDNARTKAPKDNTATLTNTIVTLATRVPERAIAPQPASVTPPPAADKPTSSLGSGYSYARAVDEEDPAEDDQPVHIPAFQASIPRSGASV